MSIHALDKALTALIMLATATAVCGQAPILWGAVDFDPQNAPIYESRIFRVADERQRQGLELLGNKEFRRLSGEELRALLPNTTLDIREMLSAQAGAAEAYAERCEKMAAEPFFASQHDSLAKSAKTHRDLARYTRGLSHLNPYLIKARVYYETSTRAFSAQFRGTQLSVVHGSLGDSTPAIRNVAVIFFLEPDVDDVVASAAIAR